MRVKRLEVQGFKSFKDKTVIHFDHSITGIVGPNGCGKSNIVDAFFWVMGEQSYKHIRGTGSDDLIFNGSSKYSPLGLAEATLVLETTVPDTQNAPAGATAADLPVHLRGKEVSITRRVYRDGSGEYFINGVPARLKDIHEFFMDTGVGAKGYSVIEQGQIGKIVNAKPEERRLLIEEAAGIAKYKARKKESLRKMEATQANLARLNDVVAEIDRNLASLERQAQKARQYKKYKEELFDKEMTWGRRKSKVLGQKLDQIKRERDLLEQELFSLRSELQIAENAIESDRVSQLTDTKSAEELQAQIQEAAGQLSQAKSALDLSRRRQGDLSQQLESLEDEQHELVGSIATERERLAGHEDEVTEAEEEFEIASVAAQTQQEAAQEERSQVDSAKRALESFKRELLQALSKSSELQSKSAGLQSRSESATDQALKLEAQIAFLQERAAATELENETAQLAFEQARIERDSLQNQKKEQQTQVTQLESELKQAERNHDEQSKLLTKVRSRLQSLEELDQANEGLGNGPKSALEWLEKNGNQDKAAPLTSLLQIGSGYEAAVAGWLDSSLESIVSTDLNLAQETLQFLSQSKQGRATLVVPGMNEGSQSDFAALEQELNPLGLETVGPLLNFVKTTGDQTAATQLALSLLQNVVVIKNSFAAYTADGASAQWISVLAKHQWSAVTLDGLSIDTNTGLLRGGMSSDASSSASLLGRKRTIAELRDQVVGLEQSSLEQEEALDQLKSRVESAKELLATTQQSLSEIQMQAAGLERDAHQINRALKEATTQLEQAQLDSSQLRDQAETSLLERTQIQSQLEELLAKKATLEETILSHEEASSTQEAALREQEAALQSLKIREASLKERATGLKRELDVGKKLIADREKRLSEVQKTLERAMREHGQFTDGDSDLLIQIEELTRKLADQHISLAEVKDRIEQSNSKLKVFLDRIKELHDTGDSKTAQVSGLSIEVEKLSGELTHLTQNLEEKYGPGCLEQPVTSPIQEEMPDPVVTHEMSLEDEQLLGEEVERLRDRIRRLGEVNVMAIDEFEEAQRRHEHLLKERADLEQSIKNLEEAIDHINKTSIDRFNRAFEAIADRFERLFPIIFGGGQAKLSLVYPEGTVNQDILEAGVDILAQPPGKKIVNIGLLSGGEKALTAVSLIFAIFMVKPSPFCILDEVDAPLDDANIGKFNALLREMSAKSQFIIITHNKKTMELNDTLYGVTMEEPGVSKMVSIEIQ